MTQSDIYKACVGTAACGGTHEAEATLTPMERALLEVRRDLHCGAIESAAARIAEVLRSGLGGLIRADALFLQGALMSQMGNYTDAGHWYSEAATLFESLGESRRALRARINSRISHTSQPEPYVTGDLYALEQEARRLNFLDLAANIQRGRACEWMIQGRFAEAASELKECVRNYELDGFPADLAIARALLAISLLLLGDAESAEETLRRMPIRDGKVKSFLDAYELLRNGKAPEFPSGHPLASIPWKTFIVKRASVPGKILQLLAKGPASRDEVIEYVWGKEAVAPSYTSRLYTAISSLKRSGRARIFFDGEKYRLLQ